jgi:hypothetical protein
LDTPVVNLCWHSHPLAPVITLIRYWRSAAAGKFLRSLKSLLVLGRATSQTVAQIRQSTAAALRLANEQAYLGKFGEVHDLLHTISAQSLLLFFNGSPSQQIVWKTAYEKAMLQEAVGTGLLVRSEAAQGGEGQTSAGNLSDRLQSLSQKVQSALHFLSRTISFSQPG